MFISSRAILTAISLCIACMWISAQAQTQFSVEPAVTTENLQGISVVREDFAIASGGAVIIRWDGSIWSNFDPMPAWPAGASYREVTAVSDNDIWLSEYNIGDYRGMSHFDGASWHVNDYVIASDRRFYGNWANGQGLFVVGLNFGIGVWNGVWREPVTSGAYCDVDASDASNIWAVSITGSVMVSKNSGVTWNPKPLPSGVNTYLTGVSVIGPNSVWISASEASNGKVYHCDGQEYKEFTIGEVGYINDIFAASDKDVWICGGNGSLAHYDGRGWRVIDLSGLGVDQDLNAIESIRVFSNSGYKDVVLVVGNNGIILRGESDPVMLIRPESFTQKLYNGAQAQFTVVSAETASGSGVKVAIQNALGWVSLDTALVGAEADRDYKVSIPLQTELFKPGAFAILTVKEYANTTSAPLGRYVTPREIRALMPCAAGEYMPRYIYFKTRSNTNFISVSVTINGNPSTVIVGPVSIGYAENEAYSNVYSPISDDLLSRDEMLARLSGRIGTAGAIVNDGGSLKIASADSYRQPIMGQQMFWNEQDRRYAEFCEANINIQVVPVQMGPYTIIDGQYQPGVWAEAGVYDFEQADAAIEHALRADPNLCIIVGLSLMPYQQWGQEHPDDVTQNEAGEMAVGAGVHNIAYRNNIVDAYSEYFCPSLYSMAYKNEMGAVVRAWIDHAKGQTYYKAVIGFMLYGGDDGQWGNWARSGSNNLGDYSPAGKAAFQNWLQAKYVSVEALRTAWKNPSVTFGDAEVPVMSQRLASGRIFLDDDDQAVVDYRRFECEETSRTVEYFGHVIKEAAGKSVIVGSYYADATYGRRNNLWASSIRRNSPYLDFFVSPLDYGLYRMPGWEGGISAATDSLKLKNKLFISELDFRTDVSSYSSDEYEQYTIGRLDSCAKFDAVNLRQTALANVLGMGQWYYQMAGGSFYSDYARDGMAAASDIYTWAQSHPARSSRRDVAVFVDETSADNVGFDAHNMIIWPSTGAMREALYLSGVPFDMYVMDDLLEAKLPDYKVYVFLDSYKLSSEQRDFINSNLKKNNKTIVWMHAIDYIQENGLSVASVSAITGMTIGLEDPCDLTTISAANSDSFFQNLQPYQNNLLLDSVSSGAKFYVDDAAATVLGRYVDGGKASITLKQLANWTSVYVAQPGGLCPDMLNAIAKKAGAYVAADWGNVVAVGGNIVMAHGVMGGNKTITLPFRADVTDLISCQRIASDVNSFAITITPKRTVVLGLEIPPMEIYIENSGTSENLADVSAIDENSAIVCGGTIATGYGVVKIDRGAGWSSFVPGLNWPAVTPFYRGVATSGPNSIWLTEYNIGDGKQCAYLDGSNWNYKGWQFGDRRFYGCWADGSGLFISATNYGIAVWNGSAWSNPVASGVFTDIKASGDTNIWAVGNGGLVSVSSNRGVSWTPKPIPNVTASLSAVSVISGQSAWIASSTASPSKVYHWDGTSYIEHAISGITNLNGIYARSDSDVWVVGSNGGVARYDGVKWSLIDIRKYGITDILNKVDGVGNSLWIVGNAGKIVKIVLNESPACSSTATADLNEDCGVDIADAAVFAQSWLDTQAPKGVIGSADLNFDGKVELSDFAILAYQWLKQD